MKVIEGNVKHIDFELIDPKTGINNAEDFVRMHDFENDFVRLKDTEYYVCGRGTAFLWLKTLKMQQILDDKIFSLAKKHGEKVYEIVKEYSAKENDLDCAIISALEGLLLYFGKEEFDKS